MKRKRKTRRGFSLISMLVAIVLLGVGISALGRANGQTVVMQTLAQNRTNAIAIGRSYLEEVRTRDPWVVTTESPVMVDADGKPSANGRYRRTLTTTAVRQNLIRVEVTIDYPRATQPVKLNSMIFRGNGLSGAQ